MVAEQPASRPYVDAPLLPGLDGVDHWSPEAARVRLGRLAAELPARLPATPRFCPGASNDVWDLGDTFLRVCWRADRDRLIRDARLLEALPAGIPHAPVLAYGRTGDLSWVLSERVPGIPLADVARDSPEPVVRDLFAQVASVLRALHGWAPPPPVRAMLAERPSLDAADPKSVWAADLVPVPAWRALAQLDLAKAVPHVDPGLIDAAAGRIRSLSGAGPPGRDPAGAVAVHGDPTAGNWLVHGGRITALLDFEWARIGPRDLELVVPVLAAQREPGHELARPRVPYLTWLEEDYPQLFGAPDLDRRLWLYELCFCLRAVIWWPPSRPEADLEAGHHIHTLRRLLDAPLRR